MNISQRVKSEGIQPTKMGRKASAGALEQRRITMERARFFSDNHNSKSIYHLPHIVIYWMSTLVMLR